jgi:hypothetical protein
MTPDQLELELTPDTVDSVTPNELSDLLIEFDYINQVEGK